VSHSDGLLDTLTIDADGVGNTADPSGFTFGSIFLALRA
jgi:hypothetical protein